MKTRQEIEVEIERLKAIEAHGIHAKFDKVKHPPLNPKESAILHYWETKAQRIKLEWALKDDLKLISV